MFHLPATYICQSRHEMVSVLYSENYTKANRSLFIIRNCFSRGLFCVVVVFYITSGEIDAVIDVTGAHQVDSIYDNHLIILAAGLPSCFFSFILSSQAGTYHSLIPFSLSYFLGWYYVFHFIHDGRSIPPSIDKLFLYTHTEQASNR